MFTEERNKSSGRRGELPALPRTRRVRSATCGKHGLVRRVTNRCVLVAGMCVRSFAVRLAEHLNIPFKEVVRKVRDNKPQKLQQNSVQQCRNLDAAFAVLEDQIDSGPVLLVDDVVDSKWTMTVVSALLLQAGSGSVFPIALAATSTGD